ncbi:unnamed protein product [Caenorhabditis brenneri]
MRYNNCKINLFIISIFLFLISSSVLAAKPTKVTKSKTKLPTTPATPTTVVTTTPTPTTVEATTERQYAELDFVDGLKTCKGIKSDNTCKKLCGKLEKAYEKAKPKSRIPYYVAGGYFFVLFLISLVLWFKIRELTDNKVKDLDQMIRKAEFNRKRFDQPDPDAESSKFQKRGGVVIATNLDRAFKKKFVEEENNEVEGSVRYVEADNEQYDFGDDVDKFESANADKSKSKSKTKTVDSKITNQ